MQSLLWVMLPAVVWSQCLTTDDKYDVTENKADEVAARIALYKAQQRFSADVLKTLNDNQKDQNIFFSPYSIYQSLLTAYIISANKTEGNIRNVLHIPETQTKLTTFGVYGIEKILHNTRLFNGSTDYELNIGNKMFISKKVGVKECLTALLKDELESVDFKADPKAAREYINNWVEKITKRHIKDLLPEDAVHEDSELILANAAYFKGLWKSKFLPENTKKNTLFYVSSDDIKIVDMMAQKGTFNHMTSERLKAHVLELPYKGDEMSMFIILPRFENNAVDKLIKQLSEESLEEAIDFDALYPRQVEIELPKFSVEQTFDLKPVLIRMGLNTFFENEGDFSTLTGTSESVHFNSAIHKAKVEVDEEGTVAAAATAIFTFRSSRPLEPTRFVANHPFVYFIYDKISKNILFMGVYRVPDKKYKNGKKIRS